MMTDRRVWGLVYANIVSLLFSMCVHTCAHVIVFRVSASFKSSYMMYFTSGHVFFFVLTSGCKQKKIPKIEKSFIYHEVESWTALLFEISEHREKECTRRLQWKNIKNTSASPLCYTEAAREAIDQKLTIKFQRKESAAEINTKQLGLVYIHIYLCSILPYLLFSLKGQSVFGRECCFTQPQLRLYHS